MKNLVFVFLVFAVFASCSKDSCTGEGFLGTWTGVEKCAGISDSDVTITVTVSGGSFVLDGGSFNGETVTRDGCDLKGGNNIFGIGNKITGNLSNDGKTLKLTSEFSVGISLTSCTYELTK